MRLHFEVVGHIAKLLQLTILTGTDIIDHLNALELVEKDGQLFLTKETRDKSLDNIDDLLQKADEILETQEKLQTEVDLN